MPASVVNGPVIKRAGEVRERDATYEVGSPTGEPVAPEGNDPIQEIRATEATGILEKGAKAADKLLNLGRLDDAVTTLWRIIGAAQRELRRLPPEAQARLATPIQTLAGNPRPEGVRKLRGEERTWRIRVGPYRVVYDIHDDQRLVVTLKVALRSETTYGR